jgi:hypothetical protein
MKSTSRHGAGAVIGPKSAVTTGQRSIAPRLFVPRQIRDYCWLVLSFAAAEPFLPVDLFLQPICVGRS